MANDQDDAKLAAEIVAAIKEYDAADATRKEKAVAAGKLLAEAHKRHPGKKEFLKFLELAGGVQYSRAQELIGMAIGRKDFEQQQAENAARQQRHRDKLKAEKSEREKAKAALPKPEPAMPKPKPAGPVRNGPPADARPLQQRAPEEISAANLDAFEEACARCLPKLNTSDLEKAHAYFNDGAWKPKTNKEAA